MGKIDIAFEYIVYELEDGETAFVEEHHKELGECVEFGPMPVEEADAFIANRQKEIGLQIEAYLTKRTADRRNRSQMN